MLKKVYKITAIFFVIPCFALLCGFVAVGTIALQDEAIPFKPAGFYIAGITDGRAAPYPVAQLVINTTANKPVIKAEDLEGGATGAISRFITNNLSKDVTLRPVIITLKDLKLTETVLPNNRVDGQVKLYLAFGLKKDYGIQQLVDYQGSLHYIRSANNNAVIEPQLRRSIINSLVYFNNWMIANARDNRKLATNVSIRFTDYTEQPESDTIYYARKRPLTWADFKSKTQPQNGFAAEVMPSIAYTEQDKAANGTIYVAINLKAYLAKTDCSVAADARNDYTLNHEQRHFDIVKIIAEQYKQKVLAEKLTPDTYEAFIGMQYLDSFRDMNTMQTAYDKQTGHGRDHIAQSAWDEKIDKELKNYTAARLLSR